MIDMQTTAQFRRHDAATIDGGFRFYSLPRAADNTKELQAAIVQTLEVMGLDSFSFAPVGVEKPKRLSNWPDSLHHTFNERVEHDLIAQHAETQTRPIYLAGIVDYIEKSPLDLESNVRFLELPQLAAEHGLLDSYNIPYKTPLGVNCLFTVGKLGMDATAFKALVKRSQDLLYLLGDLVANMAVIRHAAYFFGSRALAGKISLTPKQLQLLEWLAKHNGTLKNAADAMFISLDTANKHMAAIKAALGAKTQASAVYRGIVAGLIEVDGREWE